METFIPDYSGTPTDLKTPHGISQWAQINKLQQAIKEQYKLKPL